MDRLRLIRRLVFLGGFTLLSYLFLRVTSLVLALLRKDTSRWRARTLTGWARHTARLLGMRVQVKGAPPDPPFFLVTNHLGYVDILVLASQAPCTFIAKAEVARWPVFGALCRSVNTLFIERGSKRDIPHVVEEIEGVLGRGVGVVLFPEATSSAGATVLPFRPSLLEAAARARMPVSYATLTYRTPPDAPPAHLSVCWWGEMTLLRHIQGLLRLRRFDATVTFGRGRILEENRKVLAERLRSAVEEQFEPVIGPGEGDRAAPAASGS